MKTMIRQSAPIALMVAVVLLIVVTAGTAWLTGEEPKRDEAPAPEQPALTVSVTSLAPATWAIRVTASGNIMPWQEASVGTEADGLRLADVMVNVGDRVERHQVLATFASERVSAELAQGRAATAEAQAALAEAVANAQRARQLQSSGALSAQQINQYVTAERTAQARLEAAKATERTLHLRLVQTRVLAPDDGVISARSATVGAVLPAGQELFRLIRGHRLEWRAEVAASDLARLSPGQIARVRLASDQVVEGRLRMVAPMIDTQTRNGVAYVDLPNDSPARAGMFARGEFEVGSDRVMTLPQSAVLLRDGFSYVLRVGPDSKVIQTKVTPGRRVGEDMEIIDGIDVQGRVVRTGGGFLGDGDRVRVVDALQAAGDEHQMSESGVKPVSLHLGGGGQ